MTYKIKLCNMPVVGNAYAIQIRAIRVAYRNMYIFYS